MALGATVKGRGLAAPFSFLLLTALAAVVPVACGSPDLSPPDTSPLVAHYADGTISQAAYEDWLRFHQAEDDAAQRSIQLRAIALNRALAQEATDAGMENQPPVRMALLDRESATLERALKRWNAAQVVIDPAELEREVTSRAERLRARPHRVRLRNLFLAFPPNPGVEGRARTRQHMERLREDITSGADFATVASRESESQTRHRGGLIGMVKAGELRAEIDAAAMALDTGDISPIVETEDGLTLLFAEKVFDNDVPRDFRHRVEAKLKKRDVKHAWDALTASLREDTVMNLDALQRDGAPDSTPVMTVPGHPALTAADINALLRLRGFQRPAAELPRERLREQLEAFALQLRAADLAREKRLDAEPETRAALHWGRVAIVATQALEARVQKAFVPPTEDELRAHYDAAPNAFDHPPQIRVAAIMQRANPETLRERYAHMTDLAHQVKAGTVPFEDAARTHSDLPSATKGGLSAWLTREQLAGLGPTVSKVFFALDVGTTSGLVQQKESMAGDSTLWIVRKVGQRPRRPRTFDEAREEVRRRVANETVTTLQREIEQQIISDLAVRPVDPPAP